MLKLHFLYVKMQKKENNRQKPVIFCSPAGNRTWIYGLGNRYSIR